MVIRDIDLLKKLGKITVSWSINTLDEGFKNDMDDAVSIKRRLDAMKQIYDAGIHSKNSSRFVRCFLFSYSISVKLCCFISASLLTALFYHISSRD